MKTTLRDVAEAAGVSAMTVSKVLHGTGNNVRVSQERSEEIRRIAKELRYQPNHLARSLRSKRTMTVGVVFQHFTRLSEHNPYYPQLLNGVMAALFPQNYTLALCPKLVQMSEEGAISDGRFDGVLWCRPDFTEASVRRLNHSSLPVVMMHAPPGSVPGIPTYCANNEGALFKVVEHLMGLGHRRVAFVVDTINERTAEGRERALAFLKATGRAGIEGDVLVWREDPVEDLRPYCAAARPHTAIAAYSDFYAGRILEGCHTLGIEVPGDLSLVGFDSSPFCETTYPRLTAVSQPVEQMAFEATTHLLALINGEAEESPSEYPPSSIYDCGLDIRDSTSSPALTEEASL